MKTVQELVEEILSDCKLDIHAVKENDPGFVPYIVEKIKSLIKEYRADILDAAAQIAEDFEDSDCAFFIRNTYPEHLIQ